MYYIESYRSPGQWTEIAYGHNRVRELLRALPDDGKPGLVVWNTCKHTWNGLTHYVQKHKTTRADQDLALGSGKPVEKQKDFPDTVRYGVCYDVQHLNTEHEEEVRKVLRKRNLGHRNDVLDFL